jgi:hypothetical protein
VPFGFRRKSKQASPADATAAPGAIGTAGGAPFDGLTEEWRLIGVMDIRGRLSDALNKREAIAIREVKWAPIDGSAGFAAVPGLKSVDPYDLIIVLAGEGTQPPLSDEERAAHKVHKIAYDVALEAPPFRIYGTVFLFPGSEPDRLLERGSDMFLPVTDAAAYLDEQRVSDPEIDVVLVNRFYLRGVEQIDKRTRTPVQRLPGRPLGGVSYSERSR